MTDERVRVSEIVKLAAPNLERLLMLIKPLLTDDFVYSSGRKLFMVCHEGVVVIELDKTDQSVRRVAYITSDDVRTIEERLIRLNLN